MFGRLPKEVIIDGQTYPIRADFRDCLLILIAFNDKNLSDDEKGIVALEIFYKEVPDNTEEAYNQMVWFLDGGKDADAEEDNHTPVRPKVYDWEHDEQIIFSAINKVAGREVRNDDFLHFWTFLGYFSEIGEGVFSTVVSIREKLAKHKKLEKWEQDFRRNNKQLVDLPKDDVLSQESKDALTDLIG